VGLFGGVLFVFALLLSIVLHEAGHMVSARRAGGKVTEFFVGFGPKLWSFRRGETEYGVKGIPAGGYVKIVGMTDLEPIAEEDVPRAFYNKPLGARLITLAAGSFVHFLIALFLLMLIPMTFGNQKQDLSGVIGSVTSCLKQTAGDCQPGDPKSPAGLADIRVGDKIVSIAGKPVDNWDGVTAGLSAAKPGVPLDLVVLRDGARVPIQVTPQTGNKSVDNTKVTLGTMIGINVPPPHTQRLNPVASVGNGFTQFGSIAKNSVVGLIDIPKSIPKLFQQTTGNKPRTSDTPVGVVGMTSLSGGIIQNNGYGAFLGFVASINLFIGIFNLLPILPLDGGHIAIALYEAVRTRVARLRDRPDPGRVDLNKMMPVAFTFLAVFVGLSLLLIAADISNPLKFPG
jgi:membrane-associated protease RseP (regulator of RpoE activity)